MLTQAPYQPVSPFRIQTGKRAGKNLEVLMFQPSGYDFLWWWLGEHNAKLTQNSRKNALHRRLEWLLAQGENRPVPKLCPMCKQEPIAFISVVGYAEAGYSMGPEYACCTELECRRRLEAIPWADTPYFLIKPRFSFILWFENKVGREQFVRLLRQIFKLPSRITAQVAFEFFTKPPEINRPAALQERGIQSTLPMAGA